MRLDAFLVPSHHSEEDAAFRRKSRSKEREWGVGRLGVGRREVRRKTLGASGAVMHNLGRTLELLGGTPDAQASAQID